VLRFKRALIPLLMNGGKPAIGAAPFAEVFNTQRHRCLQNDSTCIARL
jgi:hypothetical protein